MSSVKLWLYGLIVHNLPETRCFGFKAALLRWCGAKVGKNVRITSSARFLGTGHIEIGDDVFISFDTMFNTNQQATIKIGNHVDIAPRVMLLTGSHVVDREGEHVAGEGKANDIEVGDGSWLCAGTIILGGAKLPPKTIVGAGEMRK